MKYFYTIPCMNPECRRVFTLQRWEKTMVKCPSCKTEQWCEYDADSEVKPAPYAVEQYRKPIRCKRLYASAKLPTRAHANDAGLDLYAARLSLNSNLFHIGTGVSVEIPPGFVGLICPRSSMNACGYTTHTGVIDSGYSGEICVTIGVNETNYNTMIVGAKIAQLVIVPCLLGDVVEEDFAGGERGTSGFGSTGR